MDALVAEYVEGDCLVLLPTLAAETFEGVATDPPYGISFMNSQWDNPEVLSPAPRGRGKVRPGPAYQAWCAIWMAQCYRLLQPSKQLCCFGAARMIHRAAAAARSCGFVDVEVTAWTYQTGVPMSVNVQKVLAKKTGDGAARFSGFGTALKPAWEAILTARKLG